MNTKLIEELKKDKEPGSLYYSWQSNIAMPMIDVLGDKITAEEANDCAKRFLENLIR